MGGINVGRKEELGDMFVVLKTPSGKIFYTRRWLHNWAVAGAFYEVPLTNEVILYV